MGGVDNSQIGTLGADWAALEEVVAALEAALGGGGVSGIPVKSTLFETVGGGGGVSAEVRSTVF